MFDWDEELWEENPSRRRKTLKKSQLDNFDKIYSDMFSVDTLNFGSYDSYSIFGNMPEIQSYEKSHEPNRKIKLGHKNKRKPVSMSAPSNSEKEVEQAISEGSKKVGRFVLKKGRPIGKKIENRLKKIIKKKNNEVTFADDQ